MLNRSAAIVLLIGFLGISSGALQYAHELQHEAEDAQMDAMAAAAGLPVQPHHHDDADCQICSDLHLFFAVFHWTPLLILLGLFVAFLTLLDKPLIHRLALVRIDCRGPPLT